MQKTNSKIITESKQNKILMLNIFFMLCSIVSILYNGMLLHRDFSNYGEISLFPLIAIIVLGVILFLNFLILKTFVGKKKEMELYGNITKINHEKHFPFNHLILKVETTGHANKTIKIKTLLIDYKELFNIGDRIYSNKRNKISVKKQYFNCKITDN